MSYTHSNERVHIEERLAYKTQLHGLEWNERLSENWDQSLTICFEWMNESSLFPKFTVYIVIIILWQIYSIEKLVLLAWTSDCVNLLDKKMFSISWDKLHNKLSPLHSVIFVTEKNNKNEKNENRQKTWNNKRILQHAFLGKNFIPSFPSF